MAITDFISALDETRSALAAVNGKIIDLETERLSVINAAPHTDDVIAALRRGVASMAGDFQHQFGAYLNDTFVDATGKAASAADRSPQQLLTIDPTRPDREELMSRSLRGDTQSLSTAALTYFLRDVLTAEIPALVDRLCPAAGDGMRQVERVAALQLIDAQMARLGEERDRLNADIGAARAALHRGRGV